MSPTQRTESSDINSVDRYLIRDKNNLESYVVWDKNNDESYILIETDNRTLRNEIPNIVSVRTEETSI